MKKTKISTAVSLILFLSVPVLASEYAVIVDKKNSEYTHKPASTLPSQDQGVPATVKNLETNELDSGNIMKENLAVSAENEDSIKITSTVSQKQTNGTGIIGTWSSNVAVLFTKNDKTGAEFNVPDYDGYIMLTLKIKDENHTQSLNSIVVESEFWTEIEADYSEWAISNVDQDWSPELSTVYENETVQQTRIIDKERTKQSIEERPKTGETRNDGSIEIETDNNITETKTETGTKAYWETTAPYIVQDWTVTEVFVDWNPDASTVYENTTVDQNREVKKERIVIDQEIRPATGDIRQVGGNRTDTTVVTEYRTLTGELEYWENIGSVTCTEWAFDRYDTWTPAESDYGRDESVDQTRKKYEIRECSGQQYRAATDEYRTANEETEYQEIQESRTVSGTQIDLNDWYTYDSGTAANWAVSSDGSYVFQAINGAPTLFESKATTYGEMTIKGRMRVLAAAGDNDWIGMAFGKTSDDDYYLWSWKNGSNSGSEEKEGHNFAKVTNEDAINWDMHLSRTGYQVLDTKHGNEGWNHGNYYNFEVIYTQSNVRVLIEGVEKININGSFPTGQIAFFNYSQGQVEYYKITEEK